MPRVEKFARLGPVGVMLSSCTSQQQNAHITESRTVLYPWHPWYGKSVSVLGAMVKGERGALFRCALHDGSRPLEIPQWMFDTAICSQTSLVTRPSVDVVSLRELGMLLSAMRPEQRVVVKGEHLSQPDRGGACETDEASGRPQADGAVSCAIGGSTLAEPSGRGARASAKTTRKISAAAPQGAARRAGGAR